MTALMFKAASASIGALAPVCGAFIVGPAQSASAAGCGSWGSTGTAGDIAGACTHGEGCTAGQRQGPDRRHR